MPNDRSGTHADADTRDEETVDPLAPKSGLKARAKTKLGVTPSDAPPGPPVPRKPGPLPRRGTGTAIEEPEDQDEQDEPDDPLAAKPDQKARDPKRTQLGVTPSDAPPGPPVHKEAGPPPRRGTGAASASTSRGATIAAFGSVPQPIASQAGASVSELPRPAAVIPAEALAAPTGVFVSDAEPGLGPDPNDFQANRATKIGTQLGGLQEVVPQAGAERARIRLVAGKVVPGTRYKLLRWLGEGGMGVVYEAEHVDIERRVALKILRFDLSQQPEMARVFRDEARAATRMGSSNIVEIFDFGELPDGRLFFCMELLEGTDLVPQTEHDWIQAPTLIGILRQLCKGLAAAHRAGIVHRDIKPENIILVSRDGRDGIVKIVDFGISAMLAAGSDKGMGVAGTPHYMAPEQIAGEQFDGRLDMYATGCLAYEMLVGHPPFPYEDLEQVLAAHMEEAPVAPSQVRPDREIPAALEQVILRCLEKSPAGRYRDMSDLEAALCEAQIAAGLRTPFDDLPLPEVEPERVENLKRRMPSPRSEFQQQGRRWLWPLVAAFSIVLALGAGGYAFFYKPDLTAEQQGEIDVLTAETNKAVALTHYVTVPEDAEIEKSAYQRVLQLEDLDGELRDAGKVAAGELRDQIAGTLLALGDKYWDAGVKGYAYEYYIWARAFDPDNKRALERAPVPIGQFQVFLEKAANGTFTEDEMKYMRVAEAFAAPEVDEGKVEEALADAALPLHMEEAVARARRAAGVKTAPRKQEEPKPETTEGTDTDVVDTDDVVEEAPETSSGGSGGGSRKGGQHDPIKRNKRDPAQSQQLANDAAAAAKAGKRGEAESLFHQALSFDNNNAAALSGLSDIYFDTGKRQKAVTFAERAVKAAPKSKAYQLKLGDAYYNVLRYRDALAAYEKAKDLGSDAAEGRIQKVKAKIGGG